MHLDQWLRQIYDTEMLTKEASGLEILFDQMAPADLLDVACGRTTIEKVAKSKDAFTASAPKGEKRAGMARPEQPRARDLVSGRGPQARATRDSLRNELRTGCPVNQDPTKLAFVDKVAREIAQQHYSVKLAQDDWYTRNVQARQAIKESPALQSGVGAALGGLAGHQLGRTYGRGLVGGLAGAGLGAGAGLLSAHLSRKNRLALARMGEEREGMVKKDEFTSPEAQQKAKVMQKSMQMVKGAPAPERKKAIARAGEALTKASSVKIAVGDTAAGQKALRALGRVLAKKKQDVASAGLSGAISSREAIGKGADLSKRLARVMGRTK